MEVVDAARCILPARRKRARKEWREDDAARGAVSEGDSRWASENPMDKSRRSRHLALLAEKSAADRGLEELVFGDTTEEGEDLLRRLQGRPSAQRGEAVSGNLLEEESCDSETDNETDNFMLSKKPAWVDEDDEVEEVIDMTHRYRKNMMKSDAERKLTKEKLQRRLQEEFQSAMGATPSWARRSMKKKNRKTKNEDDSEEDEDADLLRKTGNFVTTSESLPRGILQMKKCLHANNDRLSDAKLTTVQFHHSAQVVMTAGIDQTVSLFQVDGKTNPKIQSIYLEGFLVYKAHFSADGEQVDGKTNPKIQSIYLEGFPVYKACFSADGEQVIATSIREKLFYIYDMMDGKIIPVNHIRGLEEKFVRKFEVSPDGSFLLISGLSGYQHLVSMKTKEFVGSMKINGRAIASSFSPDGSKIYTHSDEGEVFIWDVKSRRCLNKFTDEGCLRGTCIAVSKNGQYVACGSSSGVVNVYAHDDCLRKTNPKPLKAIMNLVTAVTSLSFSPTSEILAIASRKTDDAVKLVHIPSLTVFSNFPLFKRKVISLAQSMDFSPRSGFFSIANDKGKALLYRLQHYSDF